jgi:uncharacterized protein
VAIIAILFFATLIRSMLGFGEALVAVPLLALLMPVDQAAPVAVLVSITIALIVVLLDWRHIHVRSAWNLLLSTLFGIPVGLWILTAVPERTVKGILAAVIISFSTYALLKRAGAHLHDDRLAWIFGFFAGVLGGAYGMNGPPLAIYGALRRWQPDQFRATLQAYFLPASIAGMAGYAIAGLWTRSVSDTYLTSLPAVVAATFAGRALGRRIPHGRFTAYVYSGLLVIAGILLVQSLTLK